MYVHQPGVWMSKSFYLRSTNGHGGQFAGSRVCHFLLQLADTFTKPSKPAAAHTLGCWSATLLNRFTLALIIKETDKGTIYQCSCCGQEYNELPLTFGTEVPDYYYSVPPDEREKRIEMKESLCVIDGEHFFHRGRLTIPINDNEQDLVFNVWTSISEDNFIKRNQLWDNPDRVNEEPYFGWLQTTIPTYGDTINIRTIAKENEVGQIPTIEVIELDHPLKAAQENGISFERALEIADVILHSGHRQTDNSV